MLAPGEGPLSHPLRAGPPLPRTAGRLRSLWHIAPAGAGRASRKGRGHAPYGTVRTEGPETAKAP
ncbi:hypothetical protein GCM10017688_55040 [Streptomyces ramulosus]